MITRYLWSLLALLLLLSGCEEPNQKIMKSGKVVKIGVIVPLSGQDATIGSKAFEGLQAALVLHPLTSKGDSIELTIRDDKSDPKRAVALVSEMVKKVQVDALVTLSTSDGVLAMQPVIDSLKIPTVVAIASHEKIIKEGAFISRVCMDDLQQSRVAAYFIHDELLHDKTALFYTPGSAYSESLTRSFQQEYEKIGGRIIVRLRSDISQIALDMSLDRLREEGVEAFFISVKGERAVALFQSLYARGWDVDLVGSDGLFGSLRSEGAKDTGLSEGLYVMENYADDRKTTQEERRLRVYETEAGVELNTHGHLAYESHLLLLEALSLCSDACGRDELNGRLRDAALFSGVNDKISTKEGAVQRPIFINKIEKGKMLMHLKVY